MLPRKIRNALDKALKDLIQNPFPKSSIQELTQINYTFHNKTLSPSRYFSFIRPFGYLYGVRIYQTRAWANSKTEIQLILIGTPFYLALFTQNLTNIIQQVEYAVNIYQKEKGHLAPASMHLTTFIQKEKSRLINYLVNWANLAIKAQLRDIGPNRIQLELNLHGYSKGIKHKHLKQELRYRHDYD